MTMDEAPGNCRYRKFTVPETMSSHPGNYFSGTQTITCMQVICMHTKHPRDSRVSLD